MKKKLKRSGPSGKGGASPSPKAKKPLPKIKLSAEDELSQAISGDVKSGIIETFRFSNEAVIGHVTGVCPTGSVAIDKLVGIGGFPFHRIVEVYGKEQCGKTTLMKQIAAAVQKMGGVAALYDPEEKWDKTYAVRLGVDVTKLIAIQPENKTIMAAILSFDRALQAWIDKKRTERLVLIWDSIAASSTEEELNDLKNKQPMVAAKELRRAMRVLTGKIARAKALLVVTNQTYDIINGFGHGPKTTTAGGRGIRYHATMRLELIRTETLKVGEIPCGIIGKARLYKNSMGIPRDCEYAISWLRGFDDAWSIFDSLKGVGVIKFGGGWYTLKLPETAPVNFQGGWAQLDEMMRNDPVLAEKLTAAYAALP